MNVPSWPFLVFALAGAAIFNVTSAPRWRSAVWLVLNLAFVWSLSGQIVPLLPLVGFLGLGYVGLCVACCGRRGAAAASIILILTLFIWLKRYSFIPNVLLLPPGYMAVGLSYIFFRVLHLVIDAGQGARARIGILPFLNYTLNFPAFISGPIQRYDDYQANGNLSLTLPDIGEAAWRMVLGAFKVFILSVALHVWQVDLQQAFPPTLSMGARVATGALSVALYPLFLYANFSGYTDFVIGAARLYRLRLPENFDQPFAATNFIELWSRWHISLSQWLRSYVFNPLLMSWMRRFKSARKKQYPSVVAFFVTFFLVGAWHGQTSEFLFFGVLQGGGVAGNRLYQVAMTQRLGPAGYARLGANPLYRSIARGLTFTWFAFTLIWFWASWPQIGALVGNLGLLGVVGGMTAVLIIASVILAVPDIFSPVAGWIAAILRSRYTRTAFAAGMILTLAVAGLVLRLSSPEIIYKQF